MCGRKNKYVRFGSGVACFFTSSTQAVIFDQWIFGSTLQCCNEKQASLTTVHRAMAPPGASCQINRPCAAYRKVGAKRRLVAPRLGLMLALAQDGRRAQVFASMLVFCGHGDFFALFFGRSLGASNPTRGVLGARVWVLRVADFLVAS